MRAILNDTVSEFFQRSFRIAEQPYNQKSLQSVVPTSTNLSICRIGNGNGRRDRGNVVLLSIYVHIMRRGCHQKGVRIVKNPEYHPLSHRL